MIIEFDDNELFDLMCGLSAASKGRSSKDERKIIANALKGLETTVNSVRQVRSLAIVPKAVIVPLDGPYRHPQTSLYWALAVCLVCLLAIVAIVAG